MAAPYVYGNFHAPACICIWDGPCVHVYEKYMCIRQDINKQLQDGEADQVV